MVRRKSLKGMFKNGFSKKDLKKEEESCKEGFEGMVRRVGWKEGFEGGVLREGLKDGFEWKV